MSSPLDGVDLRRRVQLCLDAELATQAAVLTELGPDVDDLLTAVADLLAAASGCGRPSSTGATGPRAAPTATRWCALATAMELFQAAALIHDDVMDDSDTRRGMPAAHRRARQPRTPTGAGRATGPVRPRGRGARRQPLPDLDRRCLRDLRAGPRPTSSAAARCST